MIPSLFAIVAALAIASAEPSVNLAISSALVAISSNTSFGIPPAAFTNPSRPIIIRPACSLERSVVSIIISCISAKFDADVPVSLATHVIFRVNCLPASPIIVISLAARAKFNLASAKGSPIPTIF